MKLRDLTGQTFNMLTVIRKAARRAGWHGAQWWCHCACGSPEKVIDGWQITSGHTKSCGCFLALTTGNRFRTHGMSRTWQYELWCGIKNRCENPAEPQWKDYGGRGIIVAPEFQAFEVFYAHLVTLGPRPRGFTFDRIDNDGDYAPGNVRWASRLTQGRNTRRVKWLSVNGKTLHLTAWARKVGITIESLRSRLDTGWTVQEALTAPPGSRLKDLRLAAAGLKSLSLKEKNSAQDKVQRAVRRGKIQKLTCAVCGSPRSEAHHTDYSQPLLVVWLCRKHHMAEHLNSLMVP
jgi:hypothetical protein